MRDRPGIGAVARAAAALRAPRLDPYWVSGVLFVLYTTLSVCRHRRMLTMSWDLGIFEQAIQAYARLQAPVADLKGPGTNILGDHFSPVTALIAPVYRAFPSPVTLLVVQAALFAVSAVPVTRLAARRLGRGRGLAIGVAYGLSWGVQRAVDFDFHEIAFAMPLLAFALEAVVCRRWRAAVLWAAPLVLVKEDLGVTAAAVGVLILLRQRSGARDRRVVVWGGGLVAFGLAATAVALGVVIPGFNSTGSYDYWNKLDGEGGGPAPVIPLDTAVRTLLWTVLPTTGLLALRSPLLIVALPTLGWRFLSHDDHYWGTDWHYSAVLMPVVFIALTDALETARRSGRPWLRSYAHQLLGRRPRGGPGAERVAAAVRADAAGDVPHTGLGEGRRTPAGADPRRVDGGIGRGPDKPAGEPVPGVLDRGHAGHRPGLRRPADRRRPGAAGSGGRRAAHASGSAVRGAGQRRRVRGAEAGAVAGRADFSPSGV
ncbi:hypothetical protein GCM10020000_48450 [Streptomyces olivoverticillatus]